MQCGKEKITVSVTQEGTTQGGGTPNNDGFVIDLSGVIPAGVVTLKAVLFEEEENLLVTANVAQTGGKITLPKTITLTQNNSENASYFFDGDESNSGARCTYMCDIYGYDIGGKFIGYFTYTTANPKEYWAAFWYFDQDCNVIGNGSNYSYNCYFKAGWNIEYTHQYDVQKESRNFYTEKPAGLNFKWVYDSGQDK